MLDPLPGPPSFIEHAAQPLADSFGLQTLPLHLHEAIFAFLFYLICDLIAAPNLSTWLFPSLYPQLPLRTRVNWNIHIVSLVQSSLICTLAFWIIFADEDRNHMDVKDRIWGYSGATGMTQAFAAGYFAWDVYVSSRYLGILGPGSLAHAISALVIVSLGFRPFANFYGVAFVLYELSTPFLNFHWFFDKCGMTGTYIQLINGILLVSSFFGCRLVWGSYLSLKIYQDIYALHNSLKSGIDLKLGVRRVDAVLRDTRLYDKNDLPSWLVFIYLGSNTLLTVLNFYWFGLMLKAMAKRFPKKPSPTRTRAKDE